MMKTDIDIKDDIFAHLKDTKLAKSVTGKIRKTLRPMNSNKEDIVISVLANVNGQIQEAVVNVNIYVKDIIRDNQAEENSQRLRTLCQLAEEALKVGRGDNYRFVLESQRVMALDKSDEHIINNRLSYKTNNE